MKKPKKRLLLVLSVVLIIALAMSAYVFAAGQLSINYLDDEGKIISSDSATLVKGTCTGGSSHDQYSIGFTTAAAPSKTGYTFSGWAVQTPWTTTTYSASTSVTVFDKDSSETGTDYTLEDVIKKTWIPAQQINLKATYTNANNCNVYLYSDLKGTPDPSAIKTYSNQAMGSTLELLIPTESGYTFIGWKDRDTGKVYGVNGLGKIPYLITSTTATNFKLDAIWVKDNDPTSTITFKDDVSGVVYFNQTVDNATEITVPGVADKPKKEGYTFDGTWTNADGKITAGNKYTVTKDTTFYADWTKNTHAVSTQATGLTLTLNPSQTNYEYGSIVTVTYAISDNKNILDTFVIKNTDGRNVPFEAGAAANTFTFKMPDSPVTITADVKQNIFDITTANASGSNATFAINQTAAIGDTVTFNVTPSTGKAISNLTIKDGSAKDVMFQKLGETAAGVCTYTFKMPASNITVTADEAQNVFTIGKGTLSGFGIETSLASDATSVTSAKIGDQVKVVLTPEAGKAIASYSVDYGVGQKVDPYNESVDANGVVTFYFEMPKNNVTVNAAAVTNVFGINVQSGTNTTTVVNDATTGTSSSTSGKAGSFVNFTVTPNTPAGTSGLYEIANVTVTGVDGNRIYVAPVEVKADGSVVYGFTMPAQGVRIDTSAALNPTQFTVSIWKYDNTYLGEETVNAKDVLGNTLKDKYAPVDREHAGYTFKGWYITSGGPTSPYGDAFAGANSVSNYSITENLVVKQYYEGSTVNVVNATDSTVLKNSVESLSVSSKYLKSDNGITETSGDLKAGGYCSSQTGADVTVTVKAKHNYKIKDVIVTGKDVIVTAKEGSPAMVKKELIGYTPGSATEGESYTYAFTMIGEDVSVEVLTEPLDYTLNVTEAPAELVKGGTYTINGYFTDNKEIAQGETAKVKVNLEPGYEIASINAEYTMAPAGTVYCQATNLGNVALNNYVPASGVTEFDITMPSAAVSFTITYKETNYTIDTTTSNNKTFNNITADREKQGYVIASVPGENKTSDLTNNIKAANVGDLVQLDVTTQHGFVFKGITVKDSKGKALTLNKVEDKKPLYQFTMPGDDVTVNAVFVKDTFTVNFENFDGRPLAKQQVIDYLDNPESLPDTPAREGYNFLGWISNNTDPAVTTPTKDRSAFTIVNNTVITAVYEKHVYDLEYTVDGGHGTFNVNNPTTAKTGDEVTFKVTAEQTGYQIKDVVGTYEKTDGSTGKINFKSTPSDLTAVDAAYTFIVPSDCVVTEFLDEIVFTATFEERKYDVNVIEKVGQDTIGVNESGKIRLNGGFTTHTTAAFGDEVSVGVQPNKGWLVDTIVITDAKGNELAKDPSDVSSDAQGYYDFTMADSDVTITVTYKLNSYTVTYNSPVNGTITPIAPTASGEKADFKSTVSFTATPADGYQIASAKATWTDNEGKKQEIKFATTPADLKVGGNYTFVMPSANVQVDVLFEEQTYNVNLESNGNADILLNNADQVKTTAKYGKTVTVDVTPHTGYQVKSIVATKTSGTDTGANIVVDPTPVTITGGVHSIVVPSGDVKIVVTMETVKYNISYNTPENGTITLNDTSVNHRATATFTATPADGYQIASAKATWTDKEGKKQEIKFATSPADMKTGGEYTFVMPNAAVAVEVLFEEQTYNINLESNGNADILLNNADQVKTTAKFGKTVTVDVTPHTGYQVKSIVATKTSGKDSGTNIVVDPTPVTITGGVHSIVVPSGDVKIVVTMETVKYNISYNTPKNGTITLNDTSVNHRATATFTATPATGYQIASAKATWIDKEGKKQEIKFATSPADVKTGGAYTFVMPNAPVAVEVLFEEQTYNVNLTVNGDAKVLLNNADQVKTTAKYGKNVTVKVTPAEGYKLDSVTAMKSGTENTIEVTPAVNSAGGTYTLTMPESDVDITATLSKIESNIESHSISFTGASHGKVTIDKTAAYGDNVLVVCDPDDGYRFESISVLDANGNSVPASFVKSDASFVTTYAFKMPDCGVKVIVNFKESSSSHYNDVRTDHWFYEAVMFVSGRGYFVGMGNGNFEPASNMNRAMFVSVLARIANVELTNYSESSFDDVASDAWYGPSVEWAVAKGIISGYGNGKFGPTDSVTREQMALIMYNYAKAEGYTISIDNPQWMDKYVDAKNISSWAEESVTWAVSTGLILGRTSDTVAPQGTATRAEVAQIVKNFCDKIIFK